MGTDGWPMPAPATEWGRRVSFPEMNGILVEIGDERIAQRSIHPATEDDQLLPESWIARLAKHLGRAVSRDPQVFRRQMVRAAAICVAAIEAFDRKYGS